MVNIVLEVTRRCNQECIHCLRGCAENIDINNRYITSLLEQIKSLDIYYNIAFSGGEPTLNLPAIEHYISECNRLNISHDYFYIATNGNKLDVEFASICLQLYAMADNKEMCAVDLSNDDHHEYIRDNEIDIMEGLKFFRKKHEESFNYFNGRVVLEGNALNHFSSSRENTVYVINDKDSLEDNTIYLNCEGNVINGCDWSYDSQRNREDIFLCNVEDFEKFYSTLAEYEYA